MQWIDGPGKTGRNDVGDKDLGVKPGKDESVGRRGPLQLEVQQLELEQQPASQEHKMEIQKVLPDPKRGHKRRRRISQETPPDPVQATRESPSGRKAETRETPSDREEKTDPDEKTREAPLDPGQGTRKLPLNRKEKT